MSTQRKTVVGVIFGGRSVEHDVSIVTGNQIIRAFDPEQYEIVAIYITRDGKWYSGEALKDLKNFEDDEVTNYKDVVEIILSPDIRHHGLIINPLRGRFSKSEVKRLDVVFPAIHGTHGEDGTLQGLLELADIAYVGCGTLSSALTNHKVMTKQIMRQNDIAVLDELMFTRTAWQDDPETILTKVEDTFKYPVFVKPATLGSSIGVAPAMDRIMLQAVLEVASNFDRHILVEPAITNGIEINCSVMGYDKDIRVSVLEQPVSFDEFLTFEEKYLRGDEGMKSADRIIPAPIDDELTNKIQEISRRAFQAVDGRGIARIDYLVRPDTQEVYLNEFNTMPGSLAFYLWQASGYSPREIVHQLVEYAREAQADKRRNVYNYQTNLIAVASTRGAKGMKASGAKLASAPNN